MWFTLVFGLLIALGQSPVSWPLVSVVALWAIVAVFLGVTTQKQALLLGWVAGVGYFAGTNFWIVEPFLVDFKRHGWMARFALALFAGGLALFWAAAFWVSFRLGASFNRRLTAWVFALAAVEMLRSYVFGGYPWGLLGYIWVETPAIQLVAYIGPHGLSFATLCLVTLPLMQGRVRGFPLGLALSIAVAASVFGLGYARLNQIAILPEKPLTLRLIQPNAPQHEKWDPDKWRVFYERQLALTAAPSATPLDLVIWPETAVPFWMDDQPVAQNRIAASAGDATIILGMRRLAGQRFYNSLVVLNQDGTSQAIYDKSHLVPFGEYIPFGNTLAKFGIHGLASDAGAGFSSGAGPRLLSLNLPNRPAPSSFLPLICYEVIFPHLVTQTKTRPDWILEITNDAWFGKISGPFQHLSQARIRAIEQGVPLIRVANTGVSAIIDAHGKLVSQLEFGATGSLDGTIPGYLPTTLYRKTSDLPIALLLLIGIALLVQAARRKRD